MDASFAAWQPLVPAPIRELIPLKGGRNSRLYKVICSTGDCYAAKEYLRHPADPRDRMRTEWTALHFLRSHGLCNVPIPIAADPPTQRAVYSFVEGQSPHPASAAPGAVAPLSAFFAQLYALRQPGLTNALPPASEACFCLAGLLRQLNARYAMLARLAPDSALHARCLRFVHEVARPRVATLGRRAARLLRGGGMTPGALLAPALRMPSPSDMGFHNAILEPDGRSTFIDFEYFGMDDPVKLTSDLCLHPAMRLNQAQRTSLVEQILHTVIDHDPGFPRRLAALLPLWRLKWCAIVLNAFVPQEDQRRCFATGAPVDAALLDQQLAKAHTLIAEEPQDDALTQPFVN